MSVRQEPPMQLIEDLMGGWFGMMGTALIGLIMALVRLAVALVVVVLVLGMHVISAAAAERPVAVARRRPQRGRRRVERPALSFLPVWMGVNEPKERRRGL